MNAASRRIDGADGIDGAGGGSGPDSSPGSAGARDGDAVTGAGVLGGTVGAAVEATTEETPVPHVEPRAVVLEPQSTAAGQARRWIAGAMDGWPATAIETAQLLLSELVTNAVLHARTRIDVRVAPSGERVRIEVADGLAIGPLPKHYEPDAETGRGLRLLTGLAEEWGVAHTDDGKVVWFVLSPSSGSDRSGEVAAAQLMVDLDDWAAMGDGSPPAPAPGSGLVLVHILQLPLAVYLEAEQHNDAVMREFALIVESAGAATDGGSDAGDHEVPLRLTELANELRSVFGKTTNGIRAQVEQALHRGQSTVDLLVAVPANGWEMLLRMADQLDEADRYCKAGQMLTLASSPRVWRFRRWYAQQVARQLSGNPPQPWEGPPA